MEFDDDPLSSPIPQKINDFGQVIGHYNNSSSPSPFIWQNGTTEPITGLGGVIALNNRGQVVGSDSQINVPLLWKNGQVTQLPALSVASDINDLGQIAGTMFAGLDSSGAGLSHAAMWQNGTVKDLGTLGGPNSFAKGINIWGQVVGSSEVVCTPDSSDLCTHAFLWQNGVMHDLGTLPGYRTSEPVGINAWGQIVGLSLDPVSCQAPCFRCPPPPCPPDALVHAFLWENGAMYDLADLIPANSGWELVLFPLDLLGGRYNYVGPTGINNLGQISGTGSIVGQVGQRAYLLVPAFP